MTMRSARGASTKLVQGCAAPAFLALFLALELASPPPSVAAGLSECEIPVALEVHIDQSGVAKSAARAALSRLANVKVVEGEPAYGDWLFGLSVAAVNLGQPPQTVAYALSVVAARRLPKSAFDAEMQRALIDQWGGPAWLYLGNVAMPAGLYQVREIVEIAVAGFDDVVLKVPRRACSGEDPR